jgi:hypothetical protein
MSATLGCGDWTCAILRRGGVTVDLEKFLSL